MNTQKVCNMRNNIAAFLDTRLLKGLYLTAITNATILLALNWGGTKLRAVFGVRIGTYLLSYFINQNSQREQEYMSSSTTDWKEVTTGYHTEM